MEKHIKSTTIDCLTGETTYEYYTDKEWEKILKLRKEAEANKPLTDKERITLLENALLEMAEIQSIEYQNRLVLDFAILELANLIGGDEMVEFYVKRIKESKMTIEQVPTFWKEKVQTELNK